MNRRQLLKLIPPALAGGLAGCTGGDNQSGDSGDSEPTDTPTESGRDSWRDVFEIEEVRVTDEQEGRDWVGFARVILTNISGRTVEDARLHFAFREYEDNPPITTITVDMSFIDPGVTKEINIRTDPLDAPPQHGSVEKIDYSFP